MSETSSAERAGAGPTSRARNLGLGLTALACVAVQFPGSLLLSGLALALWLAVLLVYDRASLARLWLPRFWLMTLLFALGSGLLLGRRSAGGLTGVISVEGLQAGLLMVLRGAFVFALASWASRALAGGALERVFGKVGLARLGAALSVAMSLLPELEQHLQQARRRSFGGAGRRLRSLRRSVVNLVAQTARLADTLASPARRRRVVAAVIGPPGSGKTTLLGKLVAELAGRGVGVGGVLQPAQREDRRTLGYALRALPGGEEQPLARARATAPAGGLGFEFDPAAWTWARSRIGEARRGSPIVVVDELGKLEAAGQGHMPALLEEISGESPGVLLLAVRADCAGAVAERLGGFGLSIRADAEPLAVDAFAARLADEALGRQRAQELEAER